tara:strand:- start:297 stop:503 length:207 start_codon:yes stop_codon:yes gene_type:complete
MVVISLIEKYVFPVCSQRRFSEIIEGACFAYPMFRAQLNIFLVRKKKAATVYLAPKLGADLVPTLSNL